MPPVRQNETQNQTAFDRKIRGHGRLARVETGLLGRTPPIGTKEQAKNPLQAKDLNGWKQIMPICGTRWPCKLLAMISHAKGSSSGEKRPA